MGKKTELSIHVPLLTALLMCSCLFACGLDFGPGIIHGIGSSGQESDYTPKSFQYTDWRDRFPKTLPEFEGLPAGYWRFLENNPLVIENLVWEDDQYPGGYIFIEDRDKRRDLVNHLAGKAPITPPPFPAYCDGYGQVYFSEEDAWNIYLAHVAHALEVEVNGLVSWSLSDYTKEELALLFDSRYLLDYVPSKGLYKFSSRLPGGRQGVSDLNASAGYEFLERNNMIGAQAETVFHFTNWLRQNLVHVNNNTPEDWDGYPGSPPVEKILAPPDGHQHWTQGCAGTTSLYIAVLQSANIPVIRAKSVFATQGGPEQAHHRVEFPTLGIGLAHADDAHNELSRRGVNEIPVEQLFCSLEELGELIDEPALDDGAPSRGEQAFFNTYSRAVGSAFLYMTDSILKRRARDLLGAGDHTLEDLLTARVCSPSDCLWKPPFDHTERSLMTEEIDSALSEIGSGDILEGSRIVLRR